MGKGFLSFLGQPYTLWPPLYPLLLSLAQVMGASDPLQAALVLQLLTFVWLAMLTAWLFWRIFPRNFALALIGNALAGTGVAFTWLFQTVGSDYLFIALTLSMVYLCDAYIVGGRWRTIWLMTLVCALAMLQRYIGITVLFTCAWVVFFHSRTTIREKVKRSFLLFFSIIPIGIWLVGLPADALVRGGSSSLLENLYQFNFSILSWFIPESELYGHPVRLRFGMWALWLGILASGLVLWKVRKKTAEVHSVRAPLFLFSVVYTIFLLAIASLSSFNSLDSRFVSPVFISLAVLLTSTIEAILSFKITTVRFMQTVFHVALYFLFLLAPGLTAFRSVTSMDIHHRAGSGYTSLDWEENQAIDYWLAHPPDGEYLVFSNYPAGVAVQTWQVSLSSPRRTAHPNVGEAVIPLDTYLPSLLVPGKNSYLLWIEPNEYTHVYSVDDLRGIVNIEILYESGDGGVYLILPLE